MRNYFIITWLLCFCIFGSGVIVDNPAILVDPKAILLLAVANTITWAFFNFMCGGFLLYCIITDD